MNITITFPYFFEENIIPGLPEGEYPVTVEVYATPYVPAKTWGPPENCYPAEGGDWEIDEGFIQFNEMKLDLVMIREDVYNAYMEDLTKASKEFWEKNGDYDPTPYCSCCGAMKKSQCKCRPTADNE